MENAITKKINFDYAQVGSVRLHYAATGNGEKLILLLHGFPEFWYSWRNQLVDLSDEYTVVAPDMRGYNLSDKPENISDYKIDKLADDVIGLIDYFGRKKAFVVGHDWGASVAWAVASKHPEYVEKLIALQVPPIPVFRKNQSLKQFLASWYVFFFQIPKLPEWLLRQNDFQGLADGLKKSTVEKDIFTEAEISEYKKSWGEMNALTSALNYYRANILNRLIGTQQETFKITVPTLFIYGEQDHAILPETVQGIEEFIDAPYEELHVPTSGHWVQQEASEAVTEMIREFIAKVYE